MSSNIIRAQLRFESNFWVEEVTVIVEETDGRCSVIIELVVKKVRLEHKQTGADFKIKSVWEDAALSPVLTELIPHNIYHNAREVHARC